MARSNGGSTEVAQRILELIGGDTGLSRLRAARVEALPDGLIFNLMDGYTLTGVVVIRKVGIGSYRVYVATLGKWVEARGADGVGPDDVRQVLWQLIGKKEPAF